MNERIKQLAEQVQVNEQIQRLAEQAGCTIDRLGYGEGNLEKFAELIVAECCAQVERQYKYATKQTSTWSMSQDVQDMLKKHFGVEE